MKFLHLLLFLAVAAFQFGCSSSETASDEPPAPSEVPSHDDTHGWGASLQNAGKR